MGKEYGNALFSLAMEEEKQQVVFDALEEVSLVFKENPAYIDLLSSPNISMSDRENALHEAFSGSVPEIVLSFLKFLCTQNRIHMIMESITEYKRLYYEWSRVITVTVKSATVLTDEEKSLLRTKLEKRESHKVEISFQTDESLLGGLLIETEDTVIDGSLRHHLQEIEEVIKR